MLATVKGAFGSNSSGELPRKLNTFKGLFSVCVHTASMMVRAVVYMANVSPGYTWISHGKVRRFQKLEKTIGDDLK